MTYRLYFSLDQTTIFVIEEMNTKEVNYIGHLLAVLGKPRMLFSRAIMITGELSGWRNSLHRDSRSDHNYYIVKRMMNKGSPIQLIDYNSALTMVEAMNA